MPGRPSQFMWSRSYRLWCYSGGCQCRLYISASRVSPAAGHAAPPNTFAMQSFPSFFGLNRARQLSAVDGSPSTNFDGANGAAMWFPDRPSRFGRSIFVSDGTHTNAHPVQCCEDSLPLKALRFSPRRCFPDHPMRQYLQERLLGHKNHLHC